MSASLLLRPLGTTAAMVTLLAGLACAPLRPSPPNPPSEAPVVHPALMLAELGSWRRPVTTESSQAQAWCDQGLNLLFGFNHEGASWSYQEATREDPGCAMAWWGVSYANGININDTEMTEQESWLAWDGLQRALELVPQADEVEAALIRALKSRYEWPNPEDRSDLEAAYAEAMLEVQRRFPREPDVAVLAAEALMDTQPWGTWTREGEPIGRIEEVVALLDGVLATHPDHPGANHFYIHAFEASSRPGVAEGAADRLARLVPGSGHLVHMPSHIWMQLGRYADTADANEQGAIMDRLWFAQVGAGDSYRPYMAHNQHFLAYAAMMEGRSAKSIEAARDIVRDLPPRLEEDKAALFDFIASSLYHVLVRFGRWEEILAEPEPSADRKLSRAMLHYARGVALANLDLVAEARAELAVFEAAAADVPEDWMPVEDGETTVLDVARPMLEGEIAFREGRPDDAVSFLREAVEAEDALPYSEPANWMQPVRHALGAVLVNEGRFEEAEAVYVEDLARYPNNGWSLLGLRDALEGQGRPQEARAFQVPFERAWARADVQPPASCYCGSRMLATVR